jgi:hypothetical protein
MRAIFWYFSLSAAGRSITLLPWNAIAVWSNVLEILCPLPVRSRW